MGPGYFRDVLSGIYNSPVEEYRVFMFLDLTSSTTLAESSGHHLYSSLIQDCFRDLSEIILSSDAQVYQYVGDEAVLTWKAGKNFDREECFLFYYSYMELLESKEDFYEEKYGLIPHFKASVTEGLVTATEVGLVKSEIAYHGEVLHIGARILSMCNKLGASLLVSSAVADNCTFRKYNYLSIPDVKVRGKQEAVEIYKVTPAKRP